ncbi:MULTISPECIES: GntR family transcriptional regulator [Acinetobacter]|uniref:GntR family transcriptional regulator n=1 Tax=Acinetobacter pecorum TaxID=2762215 RepID=A0ABR8VTT5_9GAMM|nr:MULTISPECIES: GntR family transcriptional regulator [Acinetobacter]MBD8008137.1 GntR family transcriptional regulator [Acinetobacter pecorum]OAL82940.1 GntR family transcriptional regulator [Acinetobacter sp. SFA]
MTIVRNPSTKATGKSSDNLSELVFQKIKNDIFDFKLMPGERFTESEIAESYAVSRTPIRQALYRLQQEGYVDVQFRSGWQVRPLDFKVYEELYDLRILLEGYAVEQLCQMPKDQLQVALAVLIQTWCIQPEQYIYDLRRLSVEDEAFHCHLVFAAGNAEMAKIHSEISEKIRIIRRLDFSKDYRVTATYAEHQQILKALLAQDAVSCLSILEAHIRLSRNEVKKITLEMLSCCPA